MLHRGAVCVAVRVCVIVACCLQGPGGRVCQYTVSSAMGAACWLAACARLATLLSELSCLPFLHLLAPCWQTTSCLPAPRPPGPLQIVNLQRTSEFASYQLNRDTWRNDMVQALVTNNFVFFQASE